MALPVASQSSLHRPRKLPVFSMSEALIGSGPMMGTEANKLSFVSCPPKCDGCSTSSAFELRHKEYVLSDPGRVKPVNDGPVVLAGAEPLMWQTSLVFNKLMEALEDLGRKVLIATRGSEVYAPLYDGKLTVEQFLVMPQIGPKLASMEYRGPGIDSKTVRFWRETAEAGRAHFSFTVSDVVDVYDVATFTGFHRIAQESVWLSVRSDTMPSKKERIRLARRQFGFQQAIPTP